MDVEERMRFVEGIRGGWRHLASLSDQDRALAGYAEKLPRTPAQMTPGAVEILRGVGPDHVAIHDALQVSAHFNYLNRIPAALDVHLAPTHPPPPPH